MPSVPSSGKVDVFNRRGLRRNMMGEKQQQRWYDDEEEKIEKAATVLGGKLKRTGFVVKENERVTSIRPSISKWDTAFKRVRL